MGYALDMLASYYAYVDLQYEDMERGIWTMKDGTQIKLMDMTDSHIVNCIKMLEKKDGNVPEAWIERFKRELDFRRYVKRIINGDLSWGGGEK